MGFSEESVGVLRAEWSEEECLRVDDAIIMSAGGAYFVFYVPAGNWLFRNLRCGVDCRLLGFELGCEVFAEGLIIIWVAVRLVFVLVRIAEPLIPVITGLVEKSDWLFKDELLIGVMSDEDGRDWCCWFGYPLRSNCSGMDPKASVGVVEIRMEFRLLEMLEELFSIEIYCYCCYWLCYAWFDYETDLNSERLNSLLGIHLAREIWSVGKERGGFLGIK